MEYILWNFVNIQLGIDVGLLFVIFFLTRKYIAFRKMVQLMTAESSAVPTSDKVLKGWKDTLSGLPEDSAKRGAYIKNIRGAEDSNELLRKADKDQREEDAAVEVRFEVLDKRLNKLQLERHQLKVDMNGRRRHRG